MQLTFAATDEKENGVDVVKGFSSKNYYLAIDNVSGYINVSKRSLTIQIGSSSSIYSDEVDYTDAYKNIVIVGGDGLTTWDAAALAELGGSYEDLLDIMLYTSATRTSNVGSYTISVQSYDEANYDISFYSGVHTIERMEISVDIAQGGGHLRRPRRSVRRARW